MALSVVAPGVPLLELRGEASIKGDAEPPVGGEARPGVHEHACV